MDRRVKERLVGASILVVLIVLIVPELLSGPAPAPVGPRPPVSARSRAGHGPCRDAGRSCCQRGSRYRRDGPVAGCRATHDGWAIRVVVAILDGCAESGLFRAA